MRILFTGGGTGGHVFPIIAVMRELKRMAEEERILDVEIFYASPDDFGKDLIEQEGALRIKIRSGKIRRYASWRNIADAFTLVLGIFQALWNFFLIVPDVVFSKGGHGALPSVIAAIVFRIPLIIHESDAAPGLVNRFSARFAKRIGIAFAGAEEFFRGKNVALIGVPIRKRILGGDATQAKEKLAILSRLPVVGVMGGSQGAQKINNALLGCLKDMTEEYEVAHQTGANNFEDAAGEARVILEFGHTERYRAFGFLDEFQLEEFYSACDLVVSRAGASSIYEIAAWGKPSLLIPLSHAAQDHQRENAYEYAAAGAAVVIEEGNLTPHILLGEVRKLMGDPEKRKKIGEAAKRFSRVDSAEVVAREILKMGIH